MSTASRRHRMLRSRSVAVVSAAVLLTGLLASCSSDPIPLPSPTPSTSASAPVETAAPIDPNAFVPDGPASANIGYFTTTVDTLIASGGTSGGRAFIDALVAAGFDKSAMEVTPDVTSINGPVDSVFFSVKMGDGCLIGQWGEGEFTAAVMAPYTTGNCLIGETVPITW